MSSLISPKLKICSSCDTFPAHPNLRTGVDLEYNFFISPEQNYVHIKAEGKYSIGDIKTLIEVVTHDERYNPSFNSLVDIRNISYTPVVSEIMDFADFIKATKQFFKAKVALVVKGDVIYNLFKLSSHLSRKNGIMVSIFNDITEAEAWIADHSG